MRKVVYKHPLEIGGAARYGVNPGRVVHVAVQRGVPCMWVEHILDVDGSLIVDVRITGMAFEATGAGRHVGSFLMDDGAFVGHVYQITPDPVHS